MTPPLFPIDCVSLLASNLVEQPAPPAAVGRAEWPIRQAAHVTLQDLGNLGEFVAAVATLATLAYLAIQIRQNTRTVRSATHQAWVSAAADVNLLLSQSHDFTRIYRTGSQDPGKLDPEELTQFNSFLLQVFRGFEGLYFMFQHGSIDAIYWNSQVQACRTLMTSPGIRSWWARYGETFFDPRFREVVQRDMLEGPYA